MKFPDHFQQANLPTPIIPFSRFFKELPEYNIFMKRDDLTGVELSGNKVRKLDFLFMDAKEQGADHVITCGGIQSNHCRATAFYASKLGLKCTLVLRGVKESSSTGNLFLNQVLGTDIQYITPETYKQVDAYMAEISEKHQGKSYIIPEGGSNEVGAWGYVKAFYEIMEQDDQIDTIVVATGSGGTHAGLLLGKLLAKSPVNIISVNVCDDENYFKTKIDKIMQHFVERYGHKLSWQSSDIQIVDGFVGSGYAQMGPVEADIIKRIARTEGIVVDPVYTSKALAGLEQQLKKGRIPGKNVLFIHTGGIFGIFAYTQKFGLK